MSGCVMINILSAEFCSLSWDIDDAWKGSLSFPKSSEFLLFYLEILRLSVTNITPSVSFLYFPYFSVSFFPSFT